MILSSCGLWFGDDCDMHPVGAGPRTRLGPPPVAASCPARVIVDGRVYRQGIGSWLDESSLALTEYGPIMRANSAVDEPIVYALAGVDPRHILLMKTSDSDANGPMGPYAILTPEVGGDDPPSLCAYADPKDERTPPECLEEG